MVDEALHLTPDAHQHVTPEGGQTWWDFPFRPDHHECPGTAAQRTSGIAPGAGERDIHEHNIQRRMVAPAVWAHTLSSTLSLSSSVP